jgi:hypothetical protein
MSIEAIRLKALNEPASIRRAADTETDSIAAIRKQSAAQSLREGIESEGISYPNPVEDAFNMIRWFGQGIENLPDDTPLTEKLYAAGAPWVPGATGQPFQLPRQAFNVAARLAPLAAGFVGWRMGGPAGAQLVNAGLNRGASALLGMATEGALGGAAAGAVQAGVEQEPVLPNVAGGAATGAVLGGALAKLSGAGRRLAEEYAVRAGPRLSLSEIAEQTPDISRKRLQAARGRAASEAFRRMVPEGESRETVGDILFERARESARVAAGRLVKFEADPGPLAQVMHRFWQRSLRPSRHDHLERSLDAFKQFWGTWVTKAGTALRRDALAFPDNVGSESAAAFERVADLTFAYEGKLVERLRAIQALVPKHELSEGLFNFLSHSGPARLSAKGTAAAQAWRGLSDDMFRELDSRGVRELVPPEHPVGQTELLPELAEQSRLAQAADPERGGYKLVPLQYRQNYVPFYRDQKAISGLRRAGPPREAFIDKLMDSGQAETKEQAAALLDDMLDDSGKGIPLEIRGGVAQHAREALLGLPVEKDARVWMRRAIHEHARRAAEAEVLGGQDQLLGQWVERLRANNGDVGRFEGFARLALSRPWPAQVKYSQPVRDLGTAMNIAYLGPRVALLQFMQLSNTAARFGWRSLAEGLTSTIRSPEARALARESGATLPTFQLQSGEIDAMGKVGRWWMEWVTQMPKFDRGVRIVSGISGGIEAQRLAQRLLGASGRGAQTIRQRLEYLGLDPAQVIEQSGNLSREQVLTAMRNGSMKTQFGSTATDMPMAWKTDAGKLVFKLRTFAKQQTSFVTGMVDDALKGDPAPLARYLLTYPTIYFAMRPYLDLLSSRPASEDLDAEAMERIRNALEGAAWSGMFGGIGDFVNQMGASDAARPLSMVVGPAVSTIVGTGYDAWKAARGNARPLMKRALKSPVALPYHLFQKGQEWLENQP